MAVKHNCGPSQARVGSVRKGWTTTRSEQVATSGSSRPDRAANLKQSHLHSSSRVRTCRRTTSIRCQQHSPSLCKCLFRVVVRHHLRPSVLVALVKDSFCQPNLTSSSLTSMETRNGAAFRYKALSVRQPALCALNRHYE